MKTTVAIVGLGSRGRVTYAPIAKQYPDLMEITALADINPACVEEAAKEYNVPKERCFTSAEELLAQPKLADAIFICTQDQDHVREALVALEKGYHILMEKPISPSAEDCNKLLEASRKYDRKIVVCHVLRYTPFFSKIKEIISEGIIGDVVTIQAIENVGYWHQAHSFVRGNWRNSNTTSPMCLQKTCHDFDLYLWLADKTPKRVSSMGDTYFFKEACAPEGAALRCMDGCKAKENCPFDAEKIYITNKRTGIAQGNTEWPVDVLAIHPTEESIYEAIKTGPYGRCVFHCDNNVVDHQITNIENTDGSNISFSMSGFTSDGASRYCKIMGTKGDITADMTKNIIEIGLFGQPREVIDVTKLATDFSGHGGGDVRMVLEFLEMITTGKEPQGITSLVGIFIKGFWITCPKWFSSVLYIAMGWSCLSVLGQLFSLLPLHAFLWLLAGGLIYTAGGIIYALRLPLFDARHPMFGLHEIFHLFVMAGSLCHFVFMFCYLA